MKSPRLIILALAFAVVVAPLTSARSQSAAAGASEAAGHALKFENKWRIEVSEGANSDGVLLFRVTTHEGKATDVPVSIKNGRGENNVASDIRNALRKTLDSKIYKVELDDGEDVLVKKRRGENFSLELVSSTVKSVRINLDKE